jgi:hypothetical protein
MKNAATAPSAIHLTGKFCWMVFDPDGQPALWQPHHKVGGRGSCRGGQPFNTMTTPRYTISTTRT